MTPFIKINSAILMAMAAVALVWGYSAGFIVEHPSRLWAALVFALVFAVPGVVYTCLRPDPVVSVPLLNIVLIVLYFLVGSMLSYIVVTLNFPLVDAYLAAIDRSIGFDWMAVLAFFNQRPALDRYMNWAYNIPFIVTVCSVLFLTFSRRLRQIEEFTACLFLTGLATLVLSGLLPAAGAFPYFQPPEAAHGQLNVVSGYSHLEQFLGLRDGSFRALLTDEPRGLATFPSFHTIYALILIYAMRNTGVFFLVSVAINGATIASTPIFGGHHFIDLVGGLAVTAAVILVVRILYARLYGKTAAHTAAKPVAGPAAGAGDRASSRRPQPATDVI